MTKDIIITPADAKVEFFSVFGGSTSANISLNNNGDLHLLASSGHIIIGDATRDVYIGDGINEVDIVFEQNGEIRSASGKSVTVSAGRVNASNIAVNTSSPTATVHVFDSTVGSTILNVEGTNGSLFSVVDSLDGTLMSVNNNAGLPVFEVFSDDKVVAGRFNQNDLVVASSGNVGIGTNSPSAKLHVSGNTASTSTATGTLVVTGGVGVSGNVNIDSGMAAPSSHYVGRGGAIFYGGFGGSMQYLNTLGKGNVDGGDATLSFVNDSAIETVSISTSAGLVRLKYDTASTSTATGTLVVTGGVGISGNIYAGSIQNTPIGNTTRNTGAFTTLASNGATTLTANTASTSTATGTLVVTGGVGISGNLNVGGSFSAGNLNANDMVVAGNLTVSGNTTILNTETVRVEDHNIELGNVTTPTDTTANGGGITLKGATDKTLTWSSSTNAWTSNQDFRVTTNTASTSTSTGSLVVTGGVGIGGAVYAGSIQNTPIGSTTRNTGAFTTLTSNGATTFTANTASTSTATGTLVVTGGVGISGNIYAGSIQNTPIGSATRSTGAFTTLTSNGATTFTANTSSITSTNGTLVVTGGVGISGNLNVGGNISCSSTLISSNIRTTNIKDSNDITKLELQIGYGTILYDNFSVRQNLTVWLESELRGNVGITSSISSISTETGALVVVGGVGIGGNINAGGTVNRLTGNTASTSTATGTLVVTGGVGVSGNIYAGSIQNTPIGNTTRNTGAFTTLTSNGATTFTAGTASTSTATGTLAVTGGVGVSGAIYAGSIQNTPIGNTTRNTGAFTTLTSNGATTFTANTASTSTSTGTLVVTGGVGVSGNINAGGEVRANELTVHQSCFISGNLELNNNNAVMYLDSTLASTSTSTGGIRVPNGGVGIGGNINVGGTVNRLTGNTASTSTSTGTLVVTGGVGVSGNLNVGGPISVPAVHIRPSPGTGDFVELTSYNRFLLGIDGIFSGSMGTYDKFSYLAEFDNGAYWNLKLKAATVFGQTIKDVDLVDLDTEVNFGNVSFRNDGNGLGAANYVDFINNLFDLFGLNSQMETHPNKCKINFCKLDKFNFVFEETGDDNGDGFMEFPKYYIMNTIEPWGIEDGLDIDYYLVTSNRQRQAWKP
jgi:hypothetical protein